MNTEEWISVETSLPDNNDNVLIFNPRIEGGVQVAFFNIESKEWNGLSSIYLKNITHWMPLPFPPSINQKEK